MKFRRMQVNDFNLGVKMQQEVNTIIQHLAITRFICYRALTLKTCTLCFTIAIENNMTNELNTVHVLLSSLNDRLFLNITHTYININIYNHINIE